jgi:pSer/pThr/pTyr-binding forkhead associated (FHA) protein
LVNGVRLVPERAKRLRDGDRIELGAYGLSFHEGVALAQPTTMERTAELARRLFRQSQAGEHLGAPRLCVLSGPDTGKSLDIPAPPARVLVGKDPSCQLVLPDPDVTAEHAELVRDLDGVVIRNLDSKHALEINTQVVEQRRLRDGDEIRIGSTRLLFEDPAEEPIDGLNAEADHALAAPQPVASEPLEPSSAAKPTQPGPRATPRRRPPFDADVLIYALAAIVIALSIAGLVALMRTN